MVDVKTVSYCVSAGSGAGDIKAAVKTQRFAIGGNVNGLGETTWLDVTATAAAEPVLTTRDVVTGVTAPTTTRQLATIAPRHRRRRHASE